jgi:hypothetical protein
MKPEFKMIIFIGIGLALLLIGLYYGQFDTIIEYIKQISSGGTYGIPT